MSLEAFVRMDIPDTDEFAVSHGLQQRLRELLTDSEAIGAEQLFGVLGELALAVPQLETRCVQLKAECNELRADLIDQNAELLDLRGDLLDLETRLLNSGVRVAPRA